MGRNSALLFYWHPTRRESRSGLLPSINSCGTYVRRHESLSSSLWWAIGFCHSFPNHDRVGYTANAAGIRRRTTTRRSVANEMHPEYWTHVPPSFFQERPRLGKGSRSVRP